MGRVGTTDLTLQRASLLASVAIVCSVIEMILAFLVGSMADSAMFIALAHLATVDIMPGMIGRAQISALSIGEQFAFNDRRSEALAFVVTGITSIIAASSAAFRAVAHFHATSVNVLHIQQVEKTLVAASSAVVLYLLARAKRRTADVIDSNALYSDAEGESYSAYVAAGVLLTTLLTWIIPRAPLDPIAALVIAVMLAWQGIYGLRTGSHIYRADH